MEQNTDTGMPMTPVIGNKQKSGNGLKIITAVACIVAVCGTGFGVYGMMQSGQKDDQIADLKVKVETFEKSANTESSSLALQPQTDVCDDNQEGVILVRPLSGINQWEVDSFVVDGQIEYRATNDSYIAEDQKDGWSSLLNELGIVCHVKDPKIHSGSTRHTEMSISMKNGDTYNLMWLGNQSLADITTPDGTTTSYQCYHD